MDYRLQLLVLLSPLQVIVGTAGIKKGSIHIVIGGGYLHLDVDAGIVIHQQEQIQDAGFLIDGLAQKDGIENLQFPDMGGIQVEDCCQEFFQHSFIGLENSMEKVVICQLVGKLSAHLG